MPNTLLNIDYFHDEVQTRLGASGVEIELQPKDFQSFLIATLALYNRTVPRFARAALTVSVQQKKYPISHPQLQGVTAVDFVDPDRLSTDAYLDPFDPMSTVPTPSNDGMTAGQFDQGLQYLEMHRNVISAECEWHAQWEHDPATQEPAYFLYIDIRKTYLCSYEYTWHITPDDDKLTGIRWIPDGDIDWVLDYAVCRAKQTLSRIRGKFAGITGPDGGEQQVDWNELQAEGREDQIRLEEQILKRKRFLPPVLG
jgi:hypothetical protein